MKVIIPSAKIVPMDLQNLGQLPAIIYPVNQKIVFDYLYDQYGEAEYRIVCYEKIEAIRRRFFKNKSVEIVGLDRLGDLGYTIYCGVKGCKGEAYINFGDTIVMDKAVPDHGDIFFYAVDMYSSTWTYFQDEKGVITSITDKKDGHDDGYGKLFVGVFRFSHIEYLCECLEKAMEDVQTDMNSFYYALMLYSQKYGFVPVKAENWFDVGHQDKYFDTAIEVKAREFNHITIDKERGILKKYSDDVDKFIGEIKWYLKLPADIEYVRPRIFEYSVSYSDPFISMEYYGYHTIHELFLYADLSRRQWVDIFSRIRYVCDDMRRYRLQDDHIRESLEEMYLNKTMQRLDRLRENDHFRSCFDKGVIVNGRKYRSLNDIADILRILIPELLYDVNELNIIHGDLCFTNIMIDNQFSFIKVIDPRGKFGRFDIYGDERYEIAKLLHSVDGKYDYIIKDQFEIQYEADGSKIDYSIFDRNRDFDLCNLFLSSFGSVIGGDLKKIELIEALLFLSMIPLHCESLDHQMAMLATGLDILNRVTDITIREKGE